MHSDAKINCPSPQWCCLISRVFPEICVLFQISNFTVYFLFDLPSVSFNLSSSHWGDTQNSCYTVCKLLWTGTESPHLFKVQAVVHIRLSCSTRRLLAYSNGTVLFQLYYSFKPISRTNMCWLNCFILEWHHALNYSHYIIRPMPRICHSPAPKSWEISQTLGARIITGTSVAVFSFKLNMSFPRDTCKCPVCIEFAGMVL